MTEPQTPERHFEREWLIWQLGDSAFPTGGFAHSNGLEATWQQGELATTEDLVRFIEAHLSQTGRAAIPFVNEAYHVARPFSELDQFCDAFLSNQVANRGSRAQGQAFLLAVSQSFKLPVLGALREKVLNERLPGHFAPVFGEAMRLLDISHEVCLRLFLFMNLRAPLASAVRLGITGPMAAQGIQVGLSSHAERVAICCSDATILQAAQTSPLLEILQGNHDRLYSRLFQT